MKKIIIWDLCGGSQNSVYNAIGKYDDLHEIHTFDIVKPTRKNQYQVDLTDINEFDNCFLNNNIPYPDIIVASPLCNSFSQILNCGNKKFNERLGWKFNEKTNRYEIRKVDEIKKISENHNFLKNTGKYPERVIERCETGAKLLLTILKIIEIYEPYAWYIENPESSMMWDYIKHNTDFLSKSWVDINYFNKAYYYCYDLNFSKKPTIFLSNIKLNLLCENIKNPVFKKSNTRSKINNYGSAKAGETGANVKIPENLIKDIFNQFLAFIYIWKHTNGKE